MGNKGEQTAPNNYCVMALAKEWGNIIISHQAVPGILHLMPLISIDRCAILTRVLYEEAGEVGGQVEALGGPAGSANSCAAPLILRAKEADDACFTWFCKPSGAAFDRSLGRIENYASKLDQVSSVPL